MPDPNLETVKAREFLESYVNVREEANIALELPKTLESYYSDLAFFFEMGFLAGLNSS